MVRAKPLVKNCVDCGKKMSKRIHHHFRCKDCWWKNSVKRGLTSKQIDKTMSYFAKEIRNERGYRIKSS